MFRMICTSSSDVEPIDGKRPTEDFIYYAMYLVITELYNIQKEHSNKYGELVLCLDTSRGGYWRSDVYSGYKSKRKKGREESELNWNEIYQFIGKLLEVIEHHLPWRVIRYDRAEADDVILALSRTYNMFENILINSPDKDMIQAQRGTDNVQQYSALTKKWLVPENKHDNMEHWLIEHVCLGDGADEVPRIIDFTEFSDSFIEYLKNNDIDKLEVVDFNNWDNTELKEKLFNDFDVWKTNKKGEPTEKDIYKNIRFGPSALKKITDGTWELEQRKEILNKKKEELKAQGLKTTEINKEIKALEIKDETPEKRFEDWLDSHPLYRPHYDRNFTLVMEEGIPTDIWNGIIMAYKESKNDYNHKEYHNFLSENNLNKLKMITTFVSNKPLTAEDFNW